MELNIEVGQKALVTLDNWFFAPDGREYRAAFGTVKAVRTAEDSLGVKPNGRSANWYLEIGNMTIAGCQVHYALRTDACYDGPAKNWTADAQHGLKEYERPCCIYFADEVPQNALGQADAACGVSPGAMGSAAHYGGRNETD